MPEKTSRELTVWTCLQFSGFSAPRPGYLGQCLGEYPGILLYSDDTFMYKDYDQLRSALQSVVLKPENVKPVKSSKHG